MTIEVINDLITDTYKDHLETMITNPNFPWSFRPGTVSETFKSYIKCLDVIDTHQFTHLFFVDDKVISDYFRFVIPFIQALEDRYQKPYYERLIRAKANFQSKDATYPIDCHVAPHSDFLTLKGPRVETESLLYYVNESDGDTFIFNEMFNNECIDSLTVNKRISPKRGECVLFDSTYLHAGSPPRMHEYRMVINFAFRKG